jgi:hypothetical protein
MDYSKHLKACQLSISGDLANFRSRRNATGALPQYETVPGATLPDLKSISMPDAQCCAVRFLVLASHAAK